jgi:hypothetical protein
MKSLVFSRWVFIILFTIDVSFTVAASADERPNILLIMADDLGMEVLGSCGGTSLSDPLETHPITESDLTAIGKRKRLLLSQELATLRGDNEYANPSGHTFTSRRTHDVYQNTNQMQRGNHLRRDADFSCRDGQRSANEFRLDYRRNRSGGRSK